MATLSQFAVVALSQRGDPYIFGTEVNLNDRDPDAFDCSELVQWAAARCGVEFVDGAQNQRDACKKAHRLISIEAARETRGALLFRIHEGPSKDHVAISLGDGRTIEARGAAFGVNVFPVAKRVWTHGGLIPGLHPDHDAGHDGLLRQGAVGEAVRWVQRRLQMHGFDPGPADGMFGARTQNALHAFQVAHHLEADGVVGPKTRKALAAAGAHLLRVAAGVS